MEIKLTKKTIEFLEKIEIDGKDYPIHRWNIDVVQRYEQTGEQDILKELKDFSLEF